MADERYLTHHHDSYALNDGLRVYSDDDPGPGGAYHCYHIESSNGQPMVNLFFQKGPRDEPGSTPGLTVESLLSICIDRLECFQDGPFPSPENELALDSLKTALAALRCRALGRANRGVLGRAEA